MRNKPSKIIIFIYSFTLAVMLTGCWNNVDISELAIVAAVGLDKTPREGVEITVQLLKPHVIKAQTQGSEESPVWVFSARGETVFSAIRNLLTTVNRKSFFSHVQLMVISEELARDGIMDVLDLFERDPETQKKSTVLICRGITAKEVLQADSELEVIPGVHIKSVVENNSKNLGKTRSLELIDLLKCLNCPGYSPPVGLIQKISDNNQQQEKLTIRDLKVEGVAVFNKDRLLGILGPIETRGLLFAINEFRSGIINVENPQEKEKEVAFEVISSSSKMKVELKEGKPEFLIEIKAQGRLAHQAGVGDLTTPAMTIKLEKAVAAVIKKDIELAAREIQQKYQSDVLGFAKITHSRFPRYFKEVEKDWDRVFASTPIKIKVTWQTRSSALIRQSSQPR